MLDVKRLLNDLGGGTVVTRALAEQGVTLSRNTVGEWGRRNSLPSRYLGALMQVADQQGKSLDLRDYMSR